jgi:hypothetical protein
MKPTSYDMTTAPEKTPPPAVRGRVITGRGSLLGAAAGAWVGLLVGMLLALPTAGPVSPLLFLGSLTIGAFWGAVLGAQARSVADIR